jgi:phosphoribosyl 1,2-cyclic phosphodiesterase
MQVHLFGTRGSVPTPGPRYVRYGGNTSCVAISRDGEELPSLILDAGTGLASTRHFFAGRPFHGAILLGHLHWDHIYGLPFFTAGDNPHSRVHVYLPSQGNDPVEVLERPMSPPFFPIGPMMLHGAWRYQGIEEGSFEVEGFTVLAREIPHKGGRSFGYRIEDGDHSVAYLSDHSPTFIGDGPDGVGAYHEAAMAKDADLLIHDSQYTQAEFEDHSDWGHCCYDYPIHLAKRAGVKRTLLFHHDPTHTDDVLDQLGGEITDPSVSFAREGSIIEL